jgi:hypothetical protein
MTITKVFDKSSPLLYVALSTGERLTRCVLKWHRTSTSGTQDTILPRPWKMPASPTSHLRCPIARTLRNRILPTWKKPHSATGKLFGPTKWAAHPVKMIGDHLSQVNFNNA